MKGRMKVRAGDAVRCHITVQAREGIRINSRGYLLTYRTFTEAARVLTEAMTKHRDLKWTRTTVITKRRASRGPKERVCSTKELIKRRVRNKRARIRAGHPESISTTPSTT